jgi:[glutamine synthetase] adenylyltransferase / [glutamine synthetase]-adenylyl-L-tyrosine phosphorylase
MNMAETKGAVALIWHEFADGQRPLASGQNKTAQTKIQSIISQLGDKKSADMLRGIFADYPHLAEFIGAIADQSSYLAHSLRLHPDWLTQAFATFPDARLNHLLDAFSNQAAAISDDAKFMRAVRLFRNEAALLIALADCAGLWSVETVTEALSDVADAGVRAATNHLLRAAAEMGKLHIADMSAPGDGSGLVVLALGKHGARELNYSSDVDLVVFFDPETPSLPSEAEPQRIFVRIAQGLVKLLQEHTAEGFAFRVDLRLRPDPGSTQVAVSLPSAFSYYEMLGQNWERAAFIKARPIAGDTRLGAAFLKDLAPFIWRKYFDFAAIADIHAMKRQIHALRGHEDIAVAGHDIKLGRGGIREIEFFVQTQQLVFGGRRPELRRARTLNTLDDLALEGWITDSARDELKVAYRFLRTVENRLQMLADEQTQRLPDQAGALKAFARFCGYSTLNAFEVALRKQAGIVQSHYALLFEEGPSLATDVGSLVFTGTEDDPETLATLQKLGFRKPSVVTETVRGWHFGRRSAVTSARAREALTELTPALLAALGRTPEPDAALMALDSAFSHMPAATELMTLLTSNAALRDLFADILGTAPRLAQIVAQSPHVLDAVIDPAFHSPGSGDEEAEARLRAMVGLLVPMEDFLDRIREVVRQETFMVSARLLSGIFSAQRAGVAFAAIAQAALRLSLERVEATFSGEYGHVAGAKIGILALGRLGARETTATSDIDLIMLYDAPPDCKDSNGRKSLDVVTYYGRLTQRLVGAITAPTRRGVLYEIDMRLRPSGRRGPLATQFSSFVDYFQTEAETWERVALFKARPVAGDPHFLARLDNEVRHILILPCDPNKVRLDILEMRELLAKEKGDEDPWDMKFAAGALNDLDFAAAALVLTKGHEHPVLLQGGPTSIWQNAAVAGLISVSDARKLADARQLFGDVMHWQRLLVDGHFDPEKLAANVLSRIATACALPDAKVLLAHLNETRAQVKVLSDHIISGG